MFTSFTKLPSSNFAIVTKVEVFAVAGIREVSVGESLSLSTPGAAKLVEPVALSNIEASSLESTVVSVVSKPRYRVGVVAYFSTIALCGATRMKAPL